MSDLSRCRDLMKIVRDNATADAFNGKTIAIQFAKTIAMIVVLTEAIDKILDTFEATP